MEDEGGPAFRCHPVTVRVCVSLPVHKYRLGRKPYMCICATVSIGFSIGFEIPVPPRASHTPGVVRPGGRDGRAAVRAKTVYRCVARLSPFKGEAMTKARPERSRESIYHLAGILITIIATRT